MYIYLITSDVYEDGRYMKRERILTHELRISPTLFNIQVEEAKENGCKTQEGIVRYLMGHHGYKNISYQGVYEY